GRVAPPFRTLAGPPRAGGGARLSAPPHRAATVMVAYQSGRVRAAVLLRVPLGLAQRARTHRRRPRAAKAAGGAQRRRDCAVSRGGPRLAQPRGTDDGLRGRSARRRGRAPDDWRRRQLPDADPGGAGEGRQRPLRHAVAAAIANPAPLLASCAAGPLALPPPAARP